MTGIPAYDRHPPPQALRRHRPASGAAHPGPGCRARRPAAVRARPDARVRRRPAGGARGSVSSAEDGPGRVALGRTGARDPADAEGRGRIRWPAPRAICWRSRTASAISRRRAPSSRPALRATRRSMRPTMTCATCATRWRPTASRSAISPSSSAPTSSSTTSSRSSRGNPIFEAIHAAIAEWLVEQRHVTLTYPGAERDRLRVPRPDLRGDRRARCRPRRARDPRATWTRSPSSIGA